MARPVRERIDPINAPEAGLAQSGLQAHASPAHSLGVPAPHDPLSDLARALESVNPALSRYGHMKVKESKEEDEWQAGQGKKASLMGHKMTEAQLAEQHPAWQKAYRTQNTLHGALQESSDMEAEFAAEVDKPDFDFAKWRQNRVSSFMAGVSSDPDAIEAARKVFTTTEARLADAYAKKVLGETQRERAETLQLHIAETIKQSLQLPTSDRRQLFEQGAADMRKLGIDRGQYTQSLLEQMTRNVEQTRPQDWDMFDTPDLNGVTMAMHKLPNGRTVGDIVADARAKADVAQKKRVADAVAKDNEDLQFRLRTQWDADPMSIPEDATLTNIARGWIGQPGGFKDGNTAAAWVDTQRDARNKAQEAFDNFQHIMRTGVVAPAGVWEDKDMKKLGEKSTRAIWQEFDPQNPDTLRPVMGKLLGFYQRTGYLDGQLEAAMKSVGSTPLATDKDGKVTGEMPGQVRLVASLVREAQRTNNGGLINRMPEDAKAMITSFNAMIDAGRTEADAYQTAAFMVTPAGKERARAYDTPRNREQYYRTIEGKLTSVWSHWWFGTADPSNLDIAKRAIFDDAVARSAAMQIPLEDSIEHSIASYQASNVVVEAGDGRGYTVRAPTDVNQEQFVEGTKHWIDTLKAEGKYRDKEAVLIHQLNNGSYQIVGWNMLPISEPMQAQEIIDRHKRATNTDVASVTEAINISRSLANDEITPEWAYANRERVSKLDLSWGDKLSFGILWRSHAKRLAQQQLAPSNADPQAILDGAEGALDVTQPENQMGRGMPSSFELALQHVESDPHFALALAGEGTRGQVYTDAAGKRTIGIGYNIDAREPAQVTKDLIRAGVPEERLDDVLSGKSKLTVEEQARLYQIIKPQYVDIARRGVGKDFTELSPHHQAALVDVAYVTGKPQRVAEAYDAIQRKDVSALAKILQYTKDGKPTPNQRRAKLLYAMATGPNLFRHLLNEGI